MKKLYYLKEKFRFLRNASFLFSLLLSLSCFSQADTILFNNGAKIYMQQNSIMHVNGNAFISGNAGLLQNDGDLTVANSNVKGDFVIQNMTDISKGNGMYKVEGDWVNNGNFIANNSIVKLQGDTQQFITGTQITSFHNLELTGNGTGNNSKKTQTIDANIDATGTLTINDRELETDVNSMFVLNPSPLAITNNQTFGSEGFVSSVAPGVLSRVTNSTSSYFFPTGSSAGLTRYRPVEVIPNQTNDNTYTARFINHNSDNDGYLRTLTDTVVCTANDTFYHAILRTQGTDSADINIHFIPANDGSWANMAHWQIPGGVNPNKWNDMKTTNLSVSGNYTIMTRPSWKFANPGDPYLLTEAKGIPDTIQGFDAFCAGTEGTVFSASPGNAVDYTWIITSPLGIDTIYSQNPISVDWDTVSTGIHSVSFYSTSASGCKTSGVDPSGAGIYNITIYPLPHAGYDTASDGYFSEIINFNDTSIHASQWQWSFGDDDSAFIAKPSHTYSDTGTFPVMLIVTSANGCKDTVYGEIHVGEGIYIPNVFTPNSDSKNDFFYISSIGVNEFHIKIYNRWGNFIWETTAPKIEWDGRNYSGEFVPDGTYYFLLTAIMGSGDNKSMNGTVTLIR